MAILLAALLSSGCLPAEWGAKAILRPFRKPLVGARPALSHDEVRFMSDGLRLEGWLFKARSPRRGLVVYLHGIADNRRSGIGVAARLTPLGYDVLAYDARAHGRSEGSWCSYGVHEKRDLCRALDAVGAREAIVFGSSLGAAVALQAAAVEPRIKGVIAQSAFSDLPTIVRERAPFIATDREVAEALAVAGRRGGFDAADASPVAAAPRVAVPVLLIHGAQDRATSPDHSRRIAEALGGPHELLIVPAAGHNDALGRAEVWQAIERWLESLPKT